MINIEDFAKVEIKAGEILSAEPVEDSEKLINLKVDLGDEAPRTVVAGIKKFFDDPQELVGLKCAFVTNLEPRPLAGLLSEAMLLAASDGESLSPLKIDDSIPPGTLIR